MGKIFHKSPPECTNTQKPAKISFIFRGFSLSDYIQILWLWSYTILVNDMTKGLE